MSTNFLETIGNAYKFPETTYDYELVDQIVQLFVQK